MDTFGEQLRATRKIKGWTQSQLASGLCDRSVVSRIESGAMFPPLDLVREFADRLLAPQLLLGLVSTDVGEHSLGFMPLTELIRDERFDEAFRVGEALFWTFNEIGALKFMQKVADILYTMPITPNRDCISILSALLYQLISRRQLSEAFDVGLNLIKSAGLRSQFTTVLSTAHGLLALQPPERIKVTILIDLGTSHRRMGNVSSALNMYTAAQNVTESEHMRHEHARALHGLSACWLDNRQNHDNAAEAAKQACQLYRHDDPLYWLAQQNLAIAYLYTSRTLEGLRILERCGLFWEEQGDDEAIRSVQEDMHYQMSQVVGTASNG